MSLDHGPGMTEDSKQRNRLVSALAEHEQLPAKDMVDDYSSGNAGHSVITLSHMRLPTCDQFQGIKGEYFLWSFSHISPPVV